MGLPWTNDVEAVAAMIREVKYPDELFEGSEETLRALRAKVQASLGGTGSF